MWGGMCLCVCDVRGMCLCVCDVGGYVFMCV